MIRLRWPAAGIAALAAISMFASGPRTASAGAQTYHMDQTIPWTASACGWTFNGWLHEQQQYTLNPKGLLIFHYIANGQATGTNAAGETASMKLNNKELDHVWNTTPPDLGPYGGSLQAWVAANFSEILEINAQWNQRVVQHGKGRVLDNHWVFEVNQHGTQVDSVKFTATGPC